MPDNQTRTRRRQSRHATAPIEQYIATLAQLSAILVGLIVLTVALDRGAMLVAPVTLAVVIGIMLAPLANRIELAGIPSALSAGVVTALFIAGMSLVLVSVAMPLGEWSRQLPRVWANLRSVIADWQDVMTTAETVRENLKSIAGDGPSIAVEVDDGSAVGDIAWFAPAVIAQVVLFLASLYFFLASRNGLRTAVLSLCFERKLRWRVAHIFRDVGSLVSRYLLSITVVNIGLGLAVGLAMWALGMPSPLLWGILAGLLNYAIYVGPAVMAVILLGVGLATGSTMSDFVLPPAVYLSLNMVEAQFVTPFVVGRALTLNPFVVLIGVAYWIWVWGPAGGFVAVPLLLAGSVALKHIIPGMHRAHVRETNRQRVEAAGDPVPAPAE